MEALSKDEFEIIATQDQLKTVHDLAQEQLRLEKAVESAEDEVKALKKDLAKIQQGLLPDAMTAAGLSEFKTVNGDKVGVKEDLSVSVPKAKLHTIVGWLQDHGHGETVTGRISVELPQNSDNERQAALQALIDAGFEPVEDMTVNTMTLKSILKKHMAQGENIDLAEFGAFAWRKSEIKRA